MLYPKLFRSRALLRGLPCLSLLTLGSLLLVAAETAAQSVKLRWDAPADNSAVSYVVERGLASGTYTSALAVGAATEFDVQNLTAGTRYFFVVRSVNARGERSAPSNELSVLVPAAPPVDGPSTPKPPAPPPVDGPSSGPEPPAPPSATTLSVSSALGLRTALAHLTSRTVISLASGTYVLAEPLVVAGGATDVTITSRSGRASDVVIVGPPATSAVPSPPAFRVTGVERLTISDLTIRNTPGYAIVLGASVQQPRLKRLRVIDNGQFVQSLLHADGKGAKGGLIEGCVFEYAGSVSNLPSGIDIRGGRDWVVRMNRFSDAQPKTTVMFGPAVHAWQGSANTVVERNTFVNASREIVFGLGNRTPNQHTAGVISNNMIVRKAGTGARGPAISVLDSPGSLVVHNSALLAGTSKVAIEYVHPDTRDVEIANNLVDGTITAVDHATAILDSNVLKATASMFIAPTSGDLRLKRSSASAAIDRGTFVPSTAIDHEGQPRPQAAAPDVGADELPPS
ncbi:MAG TPA: right-handed parallel beta-helix repeat-containing protein [Luteitalea sp.]|nr:right-handed parallel beta-helix repeat-containing protein [Luteitalea sp.]